MNEKNETSINDTLDGTKKLLDDNGCPLSELMYKMEGRLRVQEEARIDTRNHIEKIDSFIEKLDPLMPFIKAEKEKAEQQAAFYKKILENALGGLVLGALGFIGQATITFIKQKYFPGE